jgi:hypothetical protein
MRLSVLPVCPVRYATLLQVWSEFLCTAVPYGAQAKGTRRCWKPTLTNWQNRLLTLPPTMSAVWMTMSWRSCDWTASLTTLKWLQVAK